MAVEIEAGQRAHLQGRVALLDEVAARSQRAADGELSTPASSSHRVANSAPQIHGGCGFMEESAIARLYRDQKILEIGEGTNEVQRMVIARHLGLVS
jgi:butyryl-CoA dehydrogenase